MEVRQATRGDLLQIARVAHRSLWDSCEGLLRPATITAALDRDYSPSSLKRRLLGGGLVVAVEPPGQMIGFAEAGVEEEHVAVRIHSAPDHGSEPALRLVEAVRARFPGRPVCSDVLLGNLDGERCCEAAGFVPGEIIQRTLFGEQVVERRWWCPLPE